MLGLYILNDKGEPQVISDVEAWGVWMTRHLADRRIAKTIVGDVEVSTVFLGMDHSFLPGGHKPVLFETMIFGGLHDQYTDRYTSKEDAMAGHEFACAVAMEGLH